MIRTKVKITNPEGLHARPAAKIVTACRNMDSKVTLLNGSHAASGQSILELLLLDAVSGAEIEIVADGRDQELALKRIAEICNVK